MESKTKVGIPQNLMGLVIGKRHCNLQRIKQETGAHIEVIDKKIYVSGGHQRCKKAMLQLKIIGFEAMYYSLKKQFSCDTYDCVDGTGPVCDYRLQPVDCPNQHLWHQNQEYFEISKVEEDDEIVSNGEIEMKDLNNIVTKVLQKIQKSKEDNNGEILKADFWCHFGHLYISGKVDEADQNEVYPLKELQNQFNKKSGWKMMFDSAIKNMEVEDLEEALTGSEYTRIPPHIRYDLSFLTPSCNRIRAKFFLDMDGKPNLGFSNEFIDTKGDPTSSPSNYLLCDHFYHRAKVSIAIPSLAMDVRMNIRTVSSSLDKTGLDLDKEREYEETLKTYLDKIEFNQLGEIILPDDKYMPHDFSLSYHRKCNRRFYSYDRGEDSFTIAVSEEEERNGGNDGEIKTDIHIYSDECNKLLRSGDWEPEQIVSKLPTFLSVLREIQANISTSQEE